MRIVFLFIVVLLASCTSKPEFVELQNIKIVRGIYGVPHIFAKTDTEVAYGLAWAQCEDQFITLQ